MLIDWQFGMGSEVTGFPGNLQVATVWSLGVPAVFILSWLVTSYDLFFIFVSRSSAPDTSSIHYLQNYNIIKLLFRTLVQPWPQNDWQAASQVPPL